jgi:hypothetical protein
LNVVSWGTPQLSLSEMGYADNNLSIWKWQIEAGCG